MGEDEDYDSDSTVLITDFSKNPEKIARKRRKLDATFRRVSQNNIHEASGNSPRDGKRGRYNDAGAAKWRINNFFSKSEPVTNNNETDTVSEDLKVRKELLGGSRVGEVERNDDKEVRAGCVVISDDSDDDCAAVDNKLNNQVDTNANLNPKISVLTPAAINTRRATLDSFESNETVSSNDRVKSTNPNKVNPKLKVIKPSAINARRATFNCFEINEVTCKTVDRSGTKRVHFSRNEDKNIESSDNKSNENVNKHVTEINRSIGQKRTNEHPPKPTTPHQNEILRRRNSSDVVQGKPRDLRIISSSKNIDEKPVVIEIVNQKQSTTSSSVTHKTAEVLNIDQKTSGIQDKIETCKVNKTASNKIDANHDKTTKINTINDICEDVNVSNKNNAINRRNSNVNNNEDTTNHIKCQTLNPNKRPADIDVSDGNNKINEISSVVQSTDAKQVTVDKNTINSNTSTNIALNNTNSVENTILQNLKNIMNGEIVQQREDSDALNDNDKANKKSSKPNKLNDPQRVGTDMQTVNNNDLCCDVVTKLTNDNSSKNPVIEILKHMIKGNGGQQTETIGKKKSDEKLYEANNAQSPHRIDRSHEINSNKIAETGNSKRNCDVTPDKPDSEFLVGFLKDVKKYLKEIFLKSKKLDSLRASPDMLKREIKHIKRSAKKHDASEIQYACPKCSQVSVYSSKAMHQIGSDYNPIVKSNTLKCRLCLGLQMIHTKNMEVYSELQRNKTFVKTDATHQRRQDDVSNQTSVKSNNVTNNNNNISAPESNANTSALNMTATKRHTLSKNAVTSVEANNAQSPHRIDRSHEINSNKIAETGNSKRNCDVTPDKPDSEFLVGFLKDVKKYLKLIFLKGKKLDSLRASPDMLKREIKHIKRSAKKHDASEIQYACPKCSQVSVYSSKAMHQIGSDNNPIVKSNTLKCRLCLGLQMIHTKNMEVYSELQRNKTFVKTDATHQRRQDDVSNQTSVKSNYVTTNNNNISAPESNANTSALNMTATKRHTLSKNAVTSVEAVSTEPGQNQNKIPGKSTSTKNSEQSDPEVRMKKDKATSGDKTKSHKRKVDDNGFPADLKRVRTNTSTQDKNTKATEKNKIRSSLIKTTENYDTNTATMEHVCSECTCVFSSRAGLSAHMKENHGWDNIPDKGNAIKCPLCNVHLAKTNYIAHVKVHYPNKNSELVGSDDIDITPIANECQNQDVAGTDTEHQSKAKITISSARKQYQCRICKKVLYSSFKSKKHRNEVHGNLDLKYKKLYKVTERKGRLVFLALEQTSTHIQLSTSNADVTSEGLSLGNEEEMTNDESGSLVINEMNKRKENDQINTDESASHSNHRTDQISVPQNGYENYNENSKTNQKRKRKASQNNNIIEEVKQSNVTKSKEKTMLKCLICKEIFTDFGSRKHREEEHPEFINKHLFDKVTTSDIGERGKTNDGGTNFKSKTQKEDQYEINLNNAFLWESEDEDESSNSIDGVQETTKTVTVTKPSKSFEDSNAKQTSTTRLNDVLGTNAQIIDKSDTLHETNAQKSGTVTAQSSNQAAEHETMKLGETNDVHIDDTEDPNAKINSEDSSSKKICVDETNKLPDTNTAESVDKGPKTEVEGKTNTEQKNPKRIFPDASESKPSLVNCYNCQTNFDVNDINNHECIKAVRTIYNCFTCGVNFHRDDTHERENKNNSCIENILITNVKTVQESYVFKCEDCNTSTDMYDDVIRHCQNHYNNITDPTAFCPTCQLNYNTSYFETHKHLHENEIKITNYSYKSLFSNWSSIFDDIPPDIVKEMQLRSIYKSHCVKMRVSDEGPWRYSLYQCSQCETCVPPPKLDQHCQKQCNLLAYPCPACERLFPSAEICAKHEHDHRSTEQFKIIEFNCKKDERFNLKLFEARKLEMVSRIPVADIYKCQCGICFISNEVFRKHFASCNMEFDKGKICHRCAAPRLFEAAELENHLRMHHGSAAYRFRVNRLVIQQEVEPFDFLNQENGGELEGPPNVSSAEDDINIKRELLKQEAEDWSV